MSRAPGPTARTLASLSFSTLDSGRKMPLAVLVSALMRWTRTRSRRGARARMDRIEVAWEVACVLVPSLCVLFRISDPSVLLLFLHPALSSPFHSIACPLELSIRVERKTAVEEWRPGEAGAVPPVGVLPSRFLVFLPCLPTLSSKGESSRKRRSGCTYHCD